MHELTPSNDPHLLNLFQGLAFHLAIPASLNNLTAPRIFVDSPRQPHSGMLWTQHRMYLAGDPALGAFNRSLSQLLCDEIFSAHPHNGFSFYYADPAWEDALARVILPNHPPIPNPSEYYELDVAQWAEEPPAPPEGFSLAPVTRQLTENRALENLEDLLEEMCSERPSVEAFLAQSFGTCLLHQNTIVTWVLSEYNLGQRAEVGIATHPAYQRRGFAALTSRAFIEQARQAGISHIGWHCRADNLPSGRTALSLGFQKLQDVPACLVLTDPLINLAVHGDILFQRGDAAGAAHWFARAFAAGDAPGWAYLRAACAQATLNQPEQALAYLYQAADRGFADPRHLASIPCLEPLKSTPQWRELIAKLGEPA